MREFIGVWSFLEWEPYQINVGDSDDVHTMFGPNCSCSFELKQSEGQFL